MALLLLADCRRGLGPALEQQQAPHSLLKSCHGYGHRHTMLLAMPVHVPALAVPRPIRMLRLKIVTARVSAEDTLVVKIRV